MSAEIIEGTAVEIIPEVRAVAVVQQPGQSLVAQSNDPADMVASAARLAAVLRDIVNKQHLYTDIKGKSYPHVEAWQTIGRLDNVVAREARPPIRHDDGSYEAFAEIVRLSDGMVIGSASALCGSPDDDPWGGTPAKPGKAAQGPRPENARRSMAATRAISRAFRAQYAWVMVLAGYQPTPAEEMPVDTSGQSSSPAPRSAPAAAPGGGGTPWRGPVTTGNAPVDGNLRETPDGAAFGFVITDQNNKRIQVLALGDLASALAVACADGLPEQAIVDGDLEMIPWKKDGVDKPPFRRVIALRIETPEWTLPAVSVAPSAPEGTSAAANDLGDLAW